MSSGVACGSVFRVRVRQCTMQLNYEADAWRRRLLAINVGKYLSAFPVIWLTGLQSMLQDEGAAEVRQNATRTCSTKYQGKRKKEEKKKTENKGK